MRIVNRRAHFDYHLFEKIEAGIALTGPEVKSLKAGKASLEEAFVRLKDGQAYLLNAHVHPYEFARNESYDSRRSRKLLLHKKELMALSSKMQAKNLTLIPLACYTKRGKIKVEIALAKGKKKFEKKEAVRMRDLEREAEEELKEENPPSPLNLRLRRAKGDDWFDR
jgi:SsrA-binding protein